MADDQALADIFGKAGVKVANFNADVLGQWRAIAQATAWQDYAARSPACADLLKLAEAMA